MVIIMKQQLGLFFIRWGLSAFGLWLAVKLLGTGINDTVITAGFWGFLFASLLLSAVNSLLKPLLVVVSLPAIVLTLGLFTLILNGLIVYVSMAIMPGFSMSFGNSILTGIIISLVNYIVGSALDIRRYARSTT